MPRSKIQGKTRELGRLVYSLRQEIDVFRVLGLNADEINGVAVGRKFWGYTHRLSHAAIATSICKIYEKASTWRNRHELNSIWGIIDTLGPGRSYPPAKLLAVRQFGRKYGSNRICQFPSDYLAARVRIFERKHARALKRLRKFRNKHAVHSQYGFVLRSLASHVEYEALFHFAYDFYCMTRLTFCKTHGSLMASDAGSSLKRVLVVAGIKEPKCQFPLEKAVP
jgi:hypothetical protein